jgi:hypothetical protein
LFKKNNPNFFGEDKFSSFFFKSIEEVVKKITETAVQDLLSNEQLIRRIAEITFERIRLPKDGVKGEKGKDGKDGYTPIKGFDYLNEADIKELVQKATPKKGKDYFTDKDVEYIKILAKPIAGIDYPIPENGKDSSNLEGKDIVQRINDLELTEDKQIDAKHIKGLPKEKEMRESVALFRGGLKLIWNIELNGTVDGVNATFTIPGNYPEPKEGKIIVSARGVLKDETSGDFTISGRTIVFAGIPPLGSAQPRVVLYHGK